jgi:prepilin-type N-terminal cleavage/methylation domain-containing protein
MTIKFKSLNDPPKLILPLFSTIRTRTKEFFGGAQGQTLIEVLVALGIIVVVASALSGLVVTSMGNVRFSKDQSLAAQYAQEGMEIVRDIRDSDYTAFQNIGNGTYCLAKNADTLSPNCSNANVDNFLRRVTIAQSGCAVNVARVEVSVAWRDSKCSAANPFCHAQRHETCLSAVNPVPTL